MIDLLLAGRDSLSLEQLNAKAALLERLDNKYLIPDPVLWSLMDELGGSHQVLDIDGRRQFPYDSTYFDSADFNLHLAHVQGQRLRFKVRTRTYGDGHTCFAEIKLKGLRDATIKRRHRVPVEDHGHAGEHLHDFVADGLRDHYGIGMPYSLAPAVRVSYDRFTLVHRDGVERVTVDVNLVTTDTRGQVTGRLRHGTALVEVKSPDGRGTTDLAMRQRRRRPIEHLSKFGVAVALTYPLQPHTALRHLLRTAFVGMPTDPSRSVSLAEPPRLPLAI